MCQVSNKTCTNCYGLADYSRVYANEETEDSSLPLNLPALVRRQDSLSETSVRVVLPVEGQGPSSGSALGHLWLLAIDGCPKAHGKLS